MRNSIKKIATGLLCIAVSAGMLVGITMLTGCSYADPDYQAYKEEQQAIREEENAKADCFEIVHKEAEHNENTGLAGTDYIFIYREKRTDVLYVQYSGYRSETMTVMLAPDGTPLLYSEWVEIGR